MIDIELFVKKKKKGKTIFIVYVEIKRTIKWSLVFFNLFKYEKIVKFLIYLSNHKKLRDFKIFTPTINKIRKPNHKYFWGLHLEGAARTQAPATTNNDVGSTPLGRP